MIACTYCGSDVTAHEPVVVDEGVGADATEAGRFCNYACLARHIEEERLVDGACCRIDA
jgi:hypothetical protein